MTDPIHPTACPRCDTPIGHIRGSPPYHIEKVNPTLQFFMISDAQGFNRWADDTGKVLFRDADYALSVLRSHGYEPGHHSIADPP